MPHNTDGIWWLWTNMKRPRRIWFQSLVLESPSATHQKHTHSARNTELRAGHMPSSSNARWGPRRHVDLTMGLNAIQSLISMVMKSYWCVHFIHCHFSHPNRSTYRHIDLWWYPSSHPWVCNSLWHTYVTICHLYFQRVKDRILPPWKILDEP